MGVFIREKKGYLYIDIVEGRRHHWRALGIRVSGNAVEYKEQMKLAEAVRFKTEYELKAERFGVKDALAVFDSGKVYFIEYAHKTAERSKCRETIEHMIRWVEKFKGDLTIGSIDIKFIESFQSFLEKSLARQTACSYANAFRSVMRQAKLEGVIRDNPCEKVKSVRGGSIEKPTLTREEVNRLEVTDCEGVNGEEVKRAFLFACNTGLRVSDLMTLEWGHIEKKGEGYILHKRQEKTDNTVEIALNSTAVGIIGAGRELHFSSERVFKGIGCRMDYEVIKKWVKAAGIEKNVSWHTARRTFATLLLEAGTDVFTTQRLMGHTKIQMTSVYAKSSDTVKRKAVNALERLVNGEATKDGRLDGLPS